MESSRPTPHLPLPPTVGFAQEAQPAQPVEFPTITSTDGNVWWKINRGISTQQLHQFLPDEVWQPFSHLQTEDDTLEVSVAARDQRILSHEVCIALCNVIGNERPEADSLMQLLTIYDSRPSNLHYIPLLEKATFAFCLRSTPQGTEMIYRFTLLDLFKNLRHQLHPSTRLYYYPPRTPNTFCMLWHPGDPDVFSFYWGGKRIETCKNNPITIETDQVARAARILELLGSLYLQNHIPAKIGINHKKLIEIVCNWPDQKFRQFIQFVKALPGMQPARRSQVRKRQIIVPVELRSKLFSLLQSHCNPKNSFKSRRVASVVTFTPENLLLTKLVLAVTGSRVDLDFLTAYIMWMRNPSRSDKSAIFFYETDRDQKLAGCYKIRCTPDEFKIFFEKLFSLQDGDQQDTPGSIPSLPVSTNNSIAPQPNTQTPVVDPTSSETPLSPRHLFPLDRAERLLATPIASLIKNYPSLRSIYGAVAAKLYAKWRVGNVMARALLPAQGKVAVDFTRCPEVVRDLETVLISIANETYPEIAIAIVRDILQYFEFYRPAEEGGHLVHNPLPIVAEFIYKGNERDQIAPHLLAQLVPVRAQIPQGKLSPESIKVLRQTILELKLQEWSLHAAQLDRSPGGLDGPKPCVIAEVIDRKIQLIPLTVHFANDRLDHFDADLSATLYLLAQQLRRAMKPHEVQGGLRAFDCSHTELEQLSRLNADELKLLILRPKTCLQDAESGQEEPATAPDEVTAGKGEESDDEEADITSVVAHRPRQAPNSSSEHVVNIDRVLAHLQTDKRPRSVNTERGGISKRRKIIAPRSTLGIELSAIAKGTSGGGDLLQVEKDRYFKDPDTPVVDFFSLMQKLSTQASQQVVGRVAAWEQQWKALEGQQPLDWGEVWFKTCSMSSITEQQLACVSLNTRLKRYQREELARLFNARQQYIGRIPCMTMGLGKTAVFADFLLSRHICKPQAHLGLAVVPKNILTSTEAALHQWIAESVRGAWLLHYASQPFGHFLEQLKVRIQCMRPQTVCYDEAMAFLRILGAINSAQQIQAWKTCDLHMRIPGPMLLDIAKEAAAHSRQLDLTSNRRLQHRLTRYLLVGIAQMRKAPGTHPHALEAVLRELDLQEFLTAHHANEVLITEEMLERFILKFAQLLQQSSSLKTPPIYIQYYLLLLGGILAADKTRGIPKSTWYHPEHLEHIRQFDFSSIVSCTSKKRLVELIANKKRALAIINYEGLEGYIKQYGAKSLPNLHTLVLDEAQKVNNPEIGLTQAVEQLIECQKGLCVLPVTATPFENNLGEIFQLLKLANPTLVNPRAANTLEGLIDLARKKVLDHKNTDQDFTDLSVLMLKTYGQLEVFREMLARLMNPLSIQSAQIARDWGAERIPQRVDKVIELNVLDGMEEKLKTLTKRDQRIRYVIRSLFHPTLYGSGSIAMKHIRDGSNPTFEALRQRLSQNPAAVIQESPFLKGFMSSRGLNSGVAKRQHMIVIVNKVFQAKLIEESLQKRWNAQQLAVRTYKGNMTQEERDSQIRWFKTPEDTSKVLILMEKAGGVGLNLQIAKRVFNLYGGWNPGAREQAIARAIRIGSGGKVRVYTLKSRLSKRTEGFVLEKKRAFMRYLFNGGGIAAFLRVIEFSAQHEIVKNRHLSSEQITAHLARLHSVIEGVRQELERNPERVQDYINRVRPERD